MRLDICIQELDGAKGKRMNRMPLTTQYRLQSCRIQPRIVDVLSSVSGGHPLGRSVGQKVPGDSTSPHMHMDEDPDDA